MIEAAGLEDVRKRHRRGVDVDHDSLAGGQHVGRLGLGKVGDGQGVGAAQLGDLNRAHGAAC